MFSVLWLRTTLVLHFVCLLSIISLCHTEDDHHELQSNPGTILPKTGGTVENTHKIQNSSRSDNKTELPDTSFNKTLQHPITSSDLNSTLSSQSLPSWMATIKSGALERTGFVALGFMSIIVIFFVVRGVRLRHKRSKSRKYGIITSTDMEMEPLDKEDDEEEETTLFDAQQKYSLH